MNRSFVAVVGGAAAGVAVAVIGIAMSAGLVIDGATGFTVIDEATGAGRGTLTAGTDVLYLYVLAVGLIGGGGIGYVTAALERMLRPDEPRFQPLGIGIVGAIAGAIAGYAVLRAGIGIGGEITNEVVTVSVFRGIVIFLVAGATAGAVVTVAAQRLSQPATLGLAGEAWPATAAAFARQNMPAMLIPLLAVVLIVATIVGIAQLLLAGGTVGAIIVASVISAGILGGAAYLAYGRGGTAASD